VAVLSMIKQEFHRLGVLLSVQSGRLHVTDACGLIGLQRRQVFRLLRCLKRDGAASLLSKRRGKPSNHRLPAEVRTLALSIVREPISRLWPDPVFAAPSRGQALGSGEGRRGKLYPAHATVSPKRQIWRRPPGFGSLECGAHLTPKT